MSEKELKTKNSKGEEVVVFVKKPTGKQLLDARTAAIHVVSKALDDNAKTREQMRVILKEKHIFGDDEQKKIDELSTKIAEAVKKLYKGSSAVNDDGTKFTKEDGKKLAFQIQDWRIEQLNLTLRQRELDQFTVQGLAENAEFNYLVSKCTFDEEGNLVFKSLDDYLDKQEEPYAFDSARTLAELMNRVDENYDKKLPENKFLVKHGFARESDLALINADGDTVDRDGRLINKDGRFINKANEFVDKNGNRVDEDGNMVEEFLPFD